MPALDFSLQLASATADIPAAAQFKRWVRAALRVETSLTIRIVDEAEGQQLNAAYRGRDYATNVLTFPLTEEPMLMGDIVICAPVVAREALEQGKPLLAHYAHMTVHGVLHLHGYDHEVDAQAELMEAMEIAVMQTLGFANPYAE
ncbi:MULTISPECIES: rRNA maturation RNase YbeY [unclassified Methylophilus]|jgi:probable rRNA maturation factor|uniref:rRNA maturation RNase YbeY n=1 Tax=unclassified Methylophilus TaxID=2630143 RepID=UPI000465B7BA|nr:MULTISPECIES: rRNA maturation RNase YbeY [unclassified Methylophilus]HCU85115.1 rRNA maturation RNase YbeY [Methylophilus sp.]